MTQERIYVETGRKRVLAVSLNWPGWCRAGSDETQALDALVTSASRYAKVIERTRLSYRPPEGPGQLVVAEQVAGGAATDMGVPEVVLSSDAAPMDKAELERSISLLRACWHAFDQAVDAAHGKELRKGPRGGGRELEAIMRHVLESESGYAGRIGLKIKWDDLTHLHDLKQALRDSHDRVVEGLTAVAPAGVPAPGPRGGSRWPARYFVRRVAYHVVDHVWEIEDRLQPSA